jgi:hypothetical protein
VSKSKYGHDDTDFLIDLEDILDCIKSKEEAKSNGVAADVMDCDFFNDTLQWSFPPLAIGVGYKCQNLVLYRMCGYLLHSMRSNGQFKCDTCFEKLQHHDSDPHPMSKWTAKTDYVPGVQIRISDELWALLSAIDYNIMRWQKELIGMTNMLSVVIHSVSIALSQYPVPTCASCPKLKEKIVARFVEMRVKQSSHRVGKDTVTDEGYQLSSKNMAYRYFASRCANLKKKKKTAEKQKQKEPQKKPQCATGSTRSKSDCQITPKPSTARLDLSVDKRGKEMHTETPKRPRRKGRLIRMP